ncbi:Protein of unknown function DUF2225 [Syntrophobotulus glycolicus DSM 8271]|uniref:Uncharacterized protein n=2 Tax=Syntrophobotulus TaxID=51196 RepID=F0T2D9_SYNGF|nr:Protein of unknown function DUF2225 [Syntrophobotulus glycolicus DSM 8271]
MKMSNEKRQVEPLYDKNVKCIFCGKHFKTKKVRSTFAKSFKTDSDFCPHYQEESENPLYYYVNVCPACGFAFSDEFSDYIGALTKKKIESQIADKWDRSFYCSDRDREKGIRTYKLAIYSAELAEQRHIVFANLCMRLAWIYRKQGDLDSEKRFLALAAKEYETSFINTDFAGTAMTEIQILYLIGELNRRLGNYQESLQYFQSVVEHEDRSRYIKLVNLARDQWKMAIEEYRGNQQSEPI